MCEGNTNSRFVHIVNTGNDFNDRYQIERRNFNFQIPFKDFLINEFNEILNHASRDI